MIPPDLHSPVRYHTGSLTMVAATERLGTLLAPTLDYRRRHGPVAEHGIAVVATQDGQTVGTALGHVRPETDVGEVLSLGVVPGARRRGIGAGLLRRLETALADAGCPAVQGTFRSDWAGAEALGAFLDAAGWEPPVVQKLFYKVEGMAFMGQPVMQNVPVPEGYSVDDWSTLTDADRMHVEALVAADPAIAPFSPFQHSSVVSPEFSVWLRHGGTIVGWHVVLTPRPPIAETAGLYVAPEHRKSRASMALLSVSGWRHIEAIEQGDTQFGPMARAVRVFAVEPQSREMRAFADAYFQGPGITETTVWMRGKRLG